MTSFSIPKRKAALAADAFEEKIERAFFRSETMIILDGETVQRSRNGRIETSDSDVPL
jgi:hypothetical protein